MIATVSCSVVVPTYGHPMYLRGTLVLSGLDEVPSDMRGVLHMPGHQSLCEEGNP